METLWSVLWVLAIPVLLYIVYKTMSFRVPDMHYGVVSSGFSGRYAGRDAQGREIPWCRNYDEGLYFKWPWWHARFHSKQIQVHKIEKREYMIPGGSVVVGGVVQWVPSFRCLQKFEEVPPDRIKSGLDSEIDKIIREGLVAMASEAREKAGSLCQESEKETTKRRGLDKDADKDAFILDEIVLSGAKLTDTLERRLAGRDLNTNDGEVTVRSIFGEEISYTENLWGIAIVKASIDTIEPSEKLKAARDKVSQEGFERQSEQIEFSHLLDRMTDLKERLKDVPDGEVVEAIQVWKKQASKQIHSFRGEADLGGLMGLASVIAGRTKGESSEGKREEGKGKKSS